MKKIGDKVRENAKRQRRERKEDQTRRFTEYYNKKTKYEFPPTESINMDKHFYMHRGFIKSPHIQYNGIAVYPVLCSLSDFDKPKWIQVPQSKIAKMAGISINSVIKGVEYLTKPNLLFMTSEYGSEKFLQKEKISKGRQHYNRYKVGFVRRDLMDKWKGHFFPFYTSIIESGIWAELKPRAKALYLAIRSSAYFDFKLYCEIHEYEYHEYGKDLSEEVYRDRKWEICENNLTKLSNLIGAGYEYPESEYSLGGISTSDIGSITEQLRKLGLIDRFGQWIIVYLRPKGL